MLALLATDASGRTWWPLGIAAAWLVIVGPPPLPARIDLIVSGVGQAAMVAVCCWALVTRARVPAPEPEASAVEAVRLRLSRT
jgi:hypothetical protein